MADRIKRALDNHKKGYNCSQSVVCAYCDIFGVDETTAFRMSEAFGLGMGGLMEVCGALTGMFMLLGLKNSSGNVSKALTKAATYKITKELGEEFQKAAGSLLCKEIKGVETGKSTRSCDGCIEDACAIFEKYISSLNEPVKLQAQS